MKFIKYTAFALVLIGALNWGFVGLFGFDLVAALLGNMTLLARIVYSLVGLSAIITAFTMRNCENIETAKCDEYGSCSY